MTHIPFSTLFVDHRNFDVAEMLRARFCILPPTEVYKIRGKIVECLVEVRGKASFNSSDIDYIDGLDTLITTKYMERIRNFIVLTTGVDSIDLSVRATGVKGVLRWALEKYSIFNLAKISIEFIQKLCQNRNHKEKLEYILKLLQEDPYYLLYLPNLVFGSQRLRSSINFWVEGGKVRYAVSPSPKVCRVFLEHGVPVRCHESVLRYFLAEAVAMLNPLDCYMGEPAVPIVRRRSRGESTRVIMYSRDFDYDCGMSYGEELINVLTCELLDKLEEKVMRI